MDFLRHGLRVLWVVLVLGVFSVGVFEGQVWNAISAVIIMRLLFD